MKQVRFRVTKEQHTQKNIGLQFLASGLSISHEIRQIITQKLTFMKSGGFEVKSSRFQVKSIQNLIKANVSTKTIQFDECRRGAMTLDFMKSGVIAPSMYPPN